MKRFLLLALCFLCLTSCIPLAPGTPTPNPNTQGFVIEMVTRVNELRKQNRIPELALCGSLWLAAQAHSQDMARYSRMSHTGSDGSNMVVRVERAGYRRWSALGENIAAGQKTVDDVINSWMNSSGHRANILSSKYTHIGVGRATSSAGVNYWTQTFGASGSC
jgi:uncharacterized protein YkwD